MASVRKRGNSFQLRVYAGSEESGEKVMKTKTWKPPAGLTDKQAEKEALKQAILFEQECQKGQAVSAGIRFSEFADKWFEQYARVNLRPTSYERMLLLKKRVYKEIGYLRIDKITAWQIQSFVNDLITKGSNEKNGKPLSRKTAVHYLSFISTVMNYAVKMDILNNNPCRKVSLPPKDDAEKEIYSIDEVKQLLVLLKSAPLKYSVFFTLALFCGFRRGELLGLEWRDVDIDKMTIRVSRTSNYTATKGTFTDTTKTKKSKRCLKIEPFMVELLKAFKKEQDGYANELGDKWLGNGRLFTKLDGTPMNNGTPYWWFKEFCEKQNFPFRNVHSFRHLNASLQIFAGVDVYSVSRALGHSTVATTTNIYCHELQEANMVASSAISAALNL